MAQKVFEDKEFHGLVTFFKDVTIDVVASLIMNGKLGVLNLTGKLTVGVDDTGYDVKFFGATAGSYMLWDESADSLRLVGGVGTDLYLRTGSKFFLDDDEDTFIQAVADDVIYFYVANSLRAGFTSTEFFGANAASFTLFHSAASSSTVPTICPDRGNTTTGLGLAADLQLSLIAGAVECARVYGGGFQQLNIKSITADDSVEVGNTIPAGASRVNVAGVVNDANDFIILPTALEGMELIIVCNASSNFEMRTPAGSDELINDVNADGDTLEYLCTDTEIIRLNCHADGKWIAVGYSDKGAVVTAVIPD